jgi:hypothetical protein
LIAELLAPGGFGIVREESLALMASALRRRDLEGDEKVRDFFAASCVELGIWTQSTIGKLTVPLDIDPALITVVEYKCNTFSSTMCQPHISASDSKAEYAFLFVSDYWKTRRLLGAADVLDTLLSNPVSIAKAIVDGKWDFVPKDDGGRAKDLTVMLWSAKAHLLTGTSESEARAGLIKYAQETSLNARIPGIKDIRQEYA